jgi:hypothetical protein
MQNLQRLTAKKRTNPGDASPKVHPQDESLQDNFMVNIAKHQLFVELAEECKRARKERADITKNIMALDRFSVLFVCNENGLRALNLKEVKSQYRVGQQVPYSVRF